METNVVKYYVVERLKNQVNAILINQTLLTIILYKTQIHLLVDWMESKTFSHFPRRQIICNVNVETACFLKI